MTAHPPTMTDSELLDLSGRLESLRDEVAAAPAMYSFDNPLGPLAESDYAALNAAKSVIDRLYRWRHWNAPADRCYLPTLAAVPEPQNGIGMQCPDCGGPTLDRGDALSRVCATDDCPRVFVNVSDLSSIRAVQS